MLHVDWLHLGLTITGGRGLIAEELRPSFHVDWLHLRLTITGERGLIVEELRP